MDDERMTGMGPDDMPYGADDLGAAGEVYEEDEMEQMGEMDERWAAPTIPPRGVPGDRGMRDTETGRAAGDGGVIGAAGHTGGISATPTGEIILGEAETDTGPGPVGGEMAQGNVVSGQRGQMMPGGEAGSDFDFGATPGTGVDIGGAMGSDMDPNEEDTLP